MKHSLLLVLLFSTLMGKAQHWNTLDSEFNHYQLSYPAYQWWTSYPHRPSSVDEVIYRQVLRIDSLQARLDSLIREMNRPITGAPMPDPFGGDSNLQFRGWGRNKNGVLPPEPHYTDDDSLRLHPFFYVDDSNFMVDAGITLINQLQRYFPKTASTKRFQEIVAAYLKKIRQ